MTSTPVDDPVPELVGSAEATELLGMGNKMAFWRARKRGEMLEPAQVLGCGPIWARRDVERYAAGERDFERTPVPVLAGFTEVAEVLGINPATVHRWRKAKEEAAGDGEGRMVLPVQELDCGPVWLLEPVESLAKALKAEREAKRVPA